MIYRTKIRASKLTKTRPLAKAEPDEGGRIGRHVRVEPPLRPEGVRITPPGALPVRAE